MIPLNPLFLWLLPLAALPILFHLFFRVRKRTRPFPSLMFFQRADPRLSSRKRILEWLALLLRVLAIAFLILALSRPVWMGHGRGGAVSAVLVVDNSASMSAAGEDGRSKLSRALEAASAFVADLEPKDTAGVALLVDDPGVTRPSGMVSDLSLVRATLNAVRDTEGAGSPARAFAEAFALLGSARAEKRKSTSSRTSRPPTGARSLPPCGRPRDRHHRPPDRLCAPRAGTSHRRHCSARKTSPRRPAERLQVTLVNASPIDCTVRLHTLSDEGARSTQTVASEAGKA